MKTELVHCCQTLWMMFAKPKYKNINSLAHYQYKSMLGTKIEYQQGAICSTTVTLVHIPVPLTYPFYILLCMVA